MTTPDDPFARPEQQPPTPPPPGPPAPPPPAAGHPPPGPHPGPQAGHPAPGQQLPGQPYPGFVPGPPPPPTNSLAVAALVVTLMCCGPLGMVLGIVALRQIKQTGEDGRGIALASVWIGALTTVLAALAAALVVALVALGVWADSEVDRCDDGDYGAIGSSQWLEHCAGLDLDEPWRTPGSRVDA